MLLSPPPPPPSSRPQTFVLHNSASMMQLHPFGPPLKPFGSVPPPSIRPVSYRPPPVVSVRGAARVGGPTLPVAGRAAVGPYVKGSTGEVYELIEQLQSALFGGVYRARGLKSGRDYAVKVLHKRELAKMHREARGHRNVELCEMPLSEVTYASKMRDNDHVLELLDHSEDDHCHYLASPLARGGDLLEALKEVSNATESGFQEKIVKCVVAEAAQGIAHLHSHGLALQDVSLENMLLFVDPESGNYTVKICDPGQATEFTIDKHGREEPIHFKGLLGKSFRPPELYSRRDYIATAVDSWCLGWSIFYLLTARSLFQTADPRSGDKDWIAFSTGDVEQLFRRKGARHLSRQAKDLILKLMQLDPRQRLSVDRVLDHPWFVDKPSPGRWPAPSHLVIEEREMLAKIRARLGTASRGASTNAPSDSGTVVEASAETVRERTGSTTSTTTESQRTSLRGPRLESIDSVNRTSIGSSRRSAKQVSGAHRMDSRPSMASVRSNSRLASSATHWPIAHDVNEGDRNIADTRHPSAARIVGSRCPVNSPLYGSTPCFVSPRSPRLADAIALNAYHTRLSRSPSPPPQRVPFSSIPKWTTVVDTMNARARSPSPRLLPSPSVHHHQQQSGRVGSNTMAYSPDATGRTVHYRVTSGGQSPILVGSGSAALRSRSPSFISIQGSPMEQRWPSPMPGPGRTALSPPVLGRGLRLSSRG